MNGSTTRGGPNRRSGKLNLYRNEDGSVMVEFIIVAPLLLGLFSALLFFHQTSTFIIATNQSNAIQVWQSVGIGPRGDRDLQRDDQNLIAYLQQTGDEGVLNLGSTYPRERTPFEVLGLSPRTLDDREFRPGNIDPIMGSARNSLRNRQVVNPLNILLDYRLWYRSDSDGSRSPITELPYSSTVPLISDPFSIHYLGQSQRLRNVDRLTLLQEVNYLHAAILLTIVSGNPGVIMDLERIISDLGPELASQLNDHLRRMLIALANNIAERIVDQVKNDMASFVADTARMIVDETLDAIAGTNPLLVLITNGIRPALKELSESFGKLIVDLIPVEKILDPMEEFFDDAIPDFDLPFLDLREPESPLVHGGALERAMLHRFFEQAQPLRKVDKRMDRAHDEEGRMDFGGYDAGSPPQWRLDSLFTGSGPDWQLEAGRHVWEMIQ